MPTGTSEIMLALGMDQDERFQPYWRTVELIGEEAADRLLREFPGSYLYFPKLLLTYRVYADMYRDWENGASYREIARRYGYSESHARHTIQGIRRRLYGKKGST